MNKRSITLIELMIVMLLIGIISATLAYNVRGSFSKGQEFQTRQNKAKLYNTLMLAYVEGSESLQEVVTNWKDYVTKSPLVSPSIIKDGWNEEFLVSCENNDIVIMTRREQRALQENTHITRRERRGLPENTHDHSKKKSQKR